MEVDMPEKKLIGKVTHYFTNIGVAVIQLNGELREGSKISIEGATTNIQQTADSMQINKKPVTVAKKGDSIGLKVIDRVRPGDNVYIIK
jgi:translation elongation factor EF-1alpha